MAKTFSNQHKLPKLPVPTLQETLTKYLQTIEPFLSREEHAKNEALAQDFMRPGGLGEKLQQRLLDVDRAAANNWLDDTWWIQKAYHEWREPLLVNSNWYILMRHDRNHTYPLPEQALLPVREGLEGRFSTFQVKRAAHVTQQLLDFCDDLNAERVPAEMTRAGPLCMHQYSQLIGQTRIPQHGCDRMVHVPFPNLARHIVLIVDDQLFKIDVYSTEGKRLLDGDIERQFLLALDQLTKIEASAPIGLLTCDHRDAWAVAREHLLTVDSQNRASLETIESALFCVTLDSREAATVVDHATDLAAWAKFGMHGHGGHNRWCDKSLNLVFERDGKFMCHGEHSPCDALIPAIIMEKIVQVGTDLNAPRSQALVEPPKHLAFKVDDETRKHLKAAEATIDKLSRDSDCGMLYFNEYGTQFIKKVAKTSPDAYLQMALQLAWYKQQGEGCATYETGSTRAFRNGRTETIRTFSSASKRFCEAMENKAVSTAEKEKLMRQAVAAHSKYQREAANGKGIDRHLMGLRLCLQPGESHPLFQQEIFGKSSAYLLSTSGLFAGDDFFGTGFGAMYPNGYGINYLSGAQVLKFGTESKFSALNTSTKAFGDILRQSLREMRVVIEANLPEDQKKIAAKL
ncbi:hypothetical protein DFQ26_006299 [Actinomortierella ambigua]|nr:hypothetical protein DFQ26_006299 [Actinomortierella ambigua]